MTQPNSFVDSSALLQEEKLVVADGEGPLQSLVESVRHRIRSLKYFQDDRYKTVNSTAVIEELCAVFRQEASIFAAHVEAHWTGVGVDSVQADTKGASLLDDPDLGSEANSRDYFNPENGDWLDVKGVLEYLQRDMAPSQRIVLVDEVCQRITCLAAAVKELSNDPSEGATGAEVKKVLVERDTKRCHVLKEWVDLRENVEMLKNASSSDNPIARRRFATLTSALTTLDSLNASMALHQRLVELFPLPATGSPSSSSMPFEQARRFVEEFNQKSIFPVIQARLLWKQLTESLQVKTKFSLATISEAEALEVTMAEGKSVEASRQLRKEYDQVIPLLRFGYPELRDRIWALVDQHCGLGTLRMDISTEDFELSELPGGGSSFVRVLRAVTKPTVRERKGLKAEYCIKRFVNVDDFFREMEAMRLANSDGVHHPNIAEVEFALEEGAGQHKLYFLAMPRYPMASSDWFAQYSGEKSSTNDIVRVMLEIVSGLGCLHSQGIIHGDLKPDNIMMDATSLAARPKLIDFNFSTVISSATNALRVQTAPIGITANFAPPEFSDPFAQRTPASDVYSLGKTFEAMLSKSFGMRALPGLALRWMKQLVNLMTLPTPEQRISLFRPSLIVGASVRDRLLTLAKLVAMQSAESGRGLRTDDPSNGCDWVILGMACGPAEQISVKGKCVTKQQCFEEALKLDPTYTDAWCGLGSSLGKSGSATLNNIQYNQKDCYLEALKHDSTNPIAWSELAAILSADERVRVNAAEYSKRTCFLEALKLDMQSSTAWCGVALTLNQKEQVTVNGAIYTNQLCFRKALELDATNAEGWAGMAATLEASEEVEVLEELRSRRQCLLLALKHHPTLPSAWSALAASLGKSETVTVNGVEYTKLQCYAEALKSDGTMALTWTSVGAAMAPTETLELNGVHYNTRDCFVAALKLDPKCAEAWCGAGKAMSEGEQINVNGSSYSKQSCFVEALENDCTRSGAWIGLASTLPEGEKIAVKGKNYTKLQCCLEAVHHDILSSQAWNALGMAVAVDAVETVNGSSYSCRDCFLEALKLDPTNSGGWDNLGFTMTDTNTLNVNGATYTEKQCYVESLKHDDSNSRAWHRLGFVLTTTEQASVNGLPYSKLDCFVEALKHDPKDADAWFGIGTLLTHGDKLDLAGRTYTKQQCFLEALRHDPKFSDAWYKLGLTVFVDQRVKLNGKEYSKLQCFCQALQFDPSFPDAWCGVGTSLNQTDTAQIYGSSFTKRQCFMEALKHDKGNTVAWNNLGSLLKPNEHVTVNGVVVTQRQCFIEALKHERTVHAWQNLGMSISATEQVTVNGVNYTQRQCFLEALKLDPTYSDAWYTLGISMTDKEEVTLNGVSYNKKACRAQAAQYT
jgi:serine/threonine protein kinase